MISSERANYLIRFVGTEMKKYNFKDGVAKLEGLIAEYVFVEGRTVGTGVIESKDLNRWDYTLDTYNKIASILFSLEKNYQTDCFEKLSSFFELRMIETFLSGVIMKGSKIFEKLREDERIKINKQKFSENDNLLDKNYLELLEDYLNNPIPYITQDDDYNQEIEIPEDKNQHENLYQKGNIALWYLVYLLAASQSKTEHKEQKGKNIESLKEIQKKLKDMMKEFFSRTREKGHERGGR